MSLALSIHQHGVPALTVAEITAIRSYEAAVHGSYLRDCFDQFAGENHARFGEIEMNRGVLRAHARMITTWHEAVDRLLADLLTCSTEKTAYSPAAKHFITDVVADYNRKRTDFEHATTRILLGLSSDESDYPPIVNAVDFLLQELTRA